MTEQTIEGTTNTKVDGKDVKAKATFKDNGARNDLMKLEAFHCYRCGELMEETDDQKDNTKSYHHAIPNFLKPKRNVTLPVCLKCHREINLYTVQSVPKKLKNPNLNLTISKIESVEKGLEREHKKIRKTLDELNKLKECSKKEKVK